MHARIYLLGLALLGSACGAGSCGGDKTDEGGTFVEREGQRLRRVDKDVYRAYYDPEGRLQIVEYDGNHDGKPEQIDRHRDGSSRPYLTELDRDSDGTIERREHYSDAGKLIRVEEGSGTARVSIEYDEGSRPRSISRDTDGDGKPDRREEYREGLLTTTVIDGDRDGRFDRWQRWTSGRMTAEELDTDGDGKADRRLNYSPRGQLLGVEPFTPPVAATDGGPGPTPGS